MKLLKTILAASIFSLCGFIFASPFANVSDSTYEEILSKSLVSTGNNFRLKKAIEKLRNGEDFYYAAIGGSVTEGEGPENYRDGYVYQFNKKMCDAFAAKREKVVLNNAGLCGSSSVLGLCRYEKDVINPVGRTPDLLIIEYAVNDANEPTKQRAFEAMIHDALAANDDTAIIIVYAAAVYPKTQKAMKPIADYYGLPQVSASDAYDYAVKQKYFAQTDYLKDVVHPLTAGHAMMADCIMYMMNTVDKMSVDKKNPLPETALKSPNFFNFKTIQENDRIAKIEKGSFFRKDENTQPVKKTGKPNFPQNWSHDTKAGNDSLKVIVDCKNFVICFKEQGSWLSEKFGRAEIYVDGKLYLDGKNKYVDGGAPDGWNNCVNMLVLDEPVSALHTIEIKMAKGSEKKGFTVLCMGYSD